MSEKKPTAEAVAKYAAELRKRADRQILQDVYAKPYKPSEHYARKLSARLGPEEAIKYLERRAAERDAEAREAARESEYALKRLQRHHAKDAEAKRERDLGISPGARIDRAIAKLGTMSEVPAMQIDPNPVSGGEASNDPRPTSDAQAKARRIARAAAEEIEGLVEETGRRDLGRAA